MTKGSTVFTSGHAMFVTACGALPMVNGMAMADGAVGDKLPIYRRTVNRWLPIATLLDKEGECEGERMGERLNTGEYLVADAQLTFFSQHLNLAPLPSSPISMIFSISGGHNTKLPVLTTSLLSMTT